jgi:hypothetical protein
LDSVSEGHKSSSKLILGFDNVIIIEFDYIERVGGIYARDLYNNREATKGWLATDNVFDNRVIALHRVSNLDYYYIRADPG